MFLNLCTPKLKCSSAQTGNMETDQDGEESMETESFSSAKPSTSKAVQVTPKCDQNVQVYAQDSSEETSTSGNTTTTDAPLAIWVRGKRIPTEELPEFYNEYGVAYPSDYLPSLPELSTRE